jgi:anti-sigma factor RsiW
VTCRAVGRWLGAYVDDELGVEAALAVGAHLESCPACRAACERQRAFARAVRVLYTERDVPARLRAALRPRRRPARPLAAALAAAVVAGVGVWALRAPARPLPREIQATLRLHDAAAQGAVTPALASSDAREVNGWLARTVPFAATIPPAAGGELRLAGASAIGLGGDDAAWVLYRRGADAVSLFVLPARVWPAFGRRVEQHGVEFRLLEVGTHRLVAWSHAPVSYLLVSARDRPPPEACAVCHAAPRAPAIAGFAVGS